MPHQRLHRGKEARAGGEILPFRCGDFSGGAFHPCRLHVKEIPLHQEMVSVTGSVTWISHSSSVIGIDPDPRRQRDERHANRYRPERTTEAGRQLARRWKADATPPPWPWNGGQGMNPPVHRQVWKKERTRRKQVRMRRSFASGGCYPFTRFSAVPDNLRVKRKGILGQNGRFRETQMHLGDYIGAFTTYVERQSTFH